MKSILLCCAFVVATFAQEPTIYRVAVEGDIDLGLAPYIERGIAEAKEQNADAILFEVNTFGGRVDAATNIKDAILNAGLPTIAYVNKRAISAGALITLSCEKIAMAPGSSIGASTVVDQEGGKVGEKYQSYMRSEMRATAERNGRPPDVAEAMVDERIVVEGLVDSTRLVTLTAEEAVEYKIADVVAGSRAEALAAFGYEGASLQEVESNWAEGFVRFLSSPVVSSILMMIGVVGLFTEVKTAGWGVPGTVGVVALALFFGSSFLLDLAGYLEIILFLAGVTLIIIEIFVIPGFGVPGVLGVGLAFSALFLALVNNDFLFIGDFLRAAIIQFAVTIILTFGVVALIWRFLPQTRTFQSFVLSSAVSREAGYFSGTDQATLLDKRGEAHTDLRPSGTVILDGARFDVVTSGDYISKGAKVRVVRTEGSKIVVEEVNE
jgi:membrane-bound serine protease (ClpP class)